MLYLTFKSNFPTGWSNRNTHLDQIAHTDKTFVTYIRKNIHRHKIRKIGFNNYRGMTPAYEEILNEKNKRIIPFQFFAFLNI